MALVGAYRERCAALGIKPNSQLVKTLPDAAAALTELDLEGNMIGSNGLLALLDVLAQCHALHRLSLKGNMVGTAPVEALVKVLRDHAGVRELDLADNDIRLAGPALLELVKANPRITKLCLEGTHLRPLFCNLIHFQVQRNRAGGQRPRTAPARKAPPATRESLTVDPSPGIGPQRSSLRASQDASSPAERKTVQFEAKDAGAAAAAATRPASAPAPDIDKSPASDPTKSPADSVGFGDFGTFGVAIEEGSDGGDDDKGGGGGGFGTFGGEGEGELTKVVSFASSLRERPVKGPLRRPTVCAERISEENMDSYVAPVRPKSGAEADFLMEVLEKQHLFDHLDDYELEAVVGAMQKDEFDEEEIVLFEGSEDADCFYVVYAGAVATSSAAKGDLKTYGPTEYLCEILLLYPQAAPESVRAAADGTVVFSLQRQAYKALITKASKAKREKYEGFLQKIPFLQNMTKAQLLTLADALKSSTYEPGQALISYGEEGDWLHIVVEGTVNVIGRDAEGVPVEVCSFTVGDCVGELEFINEHKCVADVVAKDRVRTAKMRRNHFELCMGPVLDILKKNAESLQVYDYYRKTLARIKDAA